MKIPLRFIIEDDDPDLLRKFSAYIEMVIIHAGFDYVRRQGIRKHECSPEDPTTDTRSYEDPLPSTRGEFEFEEDKLSEAFLKLNLLRRRILTLIYVEGLSALETAARLGCSIDYVYLQKHRALKALRDYLMNGGDKHGK